MTPDHDHHGGLAMRCMEIRGGSRAVEEFLGTPGLDAWVYSRPFEGDEHGGDVYYVSLCGGGTITRIVVADVSGHGEKVADFSETLRDLMRKNINAKSQTRLVKALNREFGQSAQLLRFATAIVATYLAHQRRLTICNAGHPRPLWYRAAQASWEWLDRDPETLGNLPLGIDDDSPYRQFAVDLGPGDVVLFYTDALTEAADDSGRLLGEDGLIALARALDPSAPDRIGPALLAEVDRHRGGRPADDDVTLLTIVHNAEGPHPPSLAEKLDVYAKVFGLKAV
jgi:sigma-B regulation protein RsbU (phosphoserine phosphatase)